MTEICGGTVVLWPDVEAIDLHCVLPAGHHTDHPPSHTLYRCQDDGGGTWEYDGGVESYRWAGENG